MEFKVQSLGFHHSSPFWFRGLGVRGLGLRGLGFRGGFRGLGVIPKNEAFWGTELIDSPLCNFYKTR